MTTNPPDIADVLRPLRTATHALHEALDSRLPIARGDASLADYAGHLRALRPWLQAVRDALAASGVPGLERIARRTDRRLAALALDLDDLGASNTSEQESALDTTPRLADEAARNPAFAWGLAYVLEGSQLGGMAMHKRLGARLAPHPLRYFQPVDAPGGLAAQWKEFVAQLGAALADPLAIDAARRGAVAGFRSLMPRFGLQGL
ncbi:heme oxygenase [Variovorax boronicumulans]|uniref:biliverdin-producing heme oxygenase n=1 Tax=Variovorax boronicumulans TaxID=436515 RepID=UPI002781C33C|nr:biliverdin-producing heme oxygenase [Variovorax boronicumulans]MDQ0068416.1 heme oxygenase [Variovorax boronicumulans]